MYELLVILGDPSLKCNWFLATPFAILVGGIGFALHGIPFGWLCLRLGHRFRTGLLYGVLPGIGSFGTALLLGCTDVAGFLGYLSGAFLLMIPIHGVSLIFFTLDGLPHKYDYKQVVLTPLILTLTLPVIGPFVALFWLAISIGLPNIIGLKTNGKENPPSIQGTTIAILALGFSIIFVSLGIWEYVTKN